MLRHRDNSRRREPSSLPFYHGTMCSDVASDMLMRESPGTFLVRRVVNTDHFYISYKTVKSKKILHSKIHFTHDSNCFIEEAEVTSTSIRRLVENLKTKGVLTIGLTQLCRLPTVSSPNNSFELSDPDTGEESESSSVLNIPYITKEEVEKKLASSPLGTWMLRSNKQGHLRVSFKSSTKVKHKVLYQRGELFSMTEEDTESPVTLLEIIMKLKEQGMITDKYSKNSDLR